MKSAVWATAKQRQVLRLLASGEARLYVLYSGAYLDLTSQDSTEDLQWATFGGLLKKRLIERSSNEYPRIYYSLTEQGRQWIERLDKKPPRKPRASEVHLASRWC